MDRILRGVSERTRSAIHLCNFFTEWQVEELPLCRVPFHFPSSALRSEKGVNQIFDAIRHVPKDVIFEDLDVLTKSVAWKIIKLKMKTSIHAFWIPNEKSTDVDITVDFVHVHPDGKKGSQGMDQFLDHQQLMSIVLNPEMCTDSYIQGTYSEPGNTAFVIQENYTSIRSQDIERACELAESISFANTFSNEHQNFGIYCALAIDTPIKILNGDLKNVSLRKATAWSKDFNLGFRANKLEKIRIRRDIVHYLPQLLRHDGLVDLPFDVVKMIMTQEFLEEMATKEGKARTREFLAQHKKKKK